MRLSTTLLALLLLLQFVVGCKNDPSEPTVHESSDGAAIETPSTKVLSRAFELALGDAALNGTLVLDGATDSVDLDLVLVVRNPVESLVVSYFFKERTGAQGRALIQLNCGDRAMYALEPFDGSSWIDALRAPEIASQLAFVRIDGAAEEPER